jgi:hypothetical protein
MELAACFAQGFPAIEDYGVSCLVDPSNLTFCWKTDGGAGFYRFPARVRTKPNDVSPGRAIRKQLATSSYWLLASSGFQVVKS